MKRRNCRKCSICKEEINILSEDYIKINSIFSHTLCYKNQQISKKNPLSEDGVNEKIRLIKENMEIKQKEQDNKELENLKKKKENLKSGITDTKNRDAFIQYIYKQYGVVVLNKLFYVKLSKINNGTYKGLSEGISYSDLLYMFQRKQDFLNKTADRKERLGQGFKDIQSRIHYDLAIIVGKYDSYKEWKEKQKLLEAEKNQIIEEEKNKINFTYINTINSITHNSDEIDISNLIDEI